MAEVTGLRNSALPYPVYASPFGVVFPVLDADGDFVTGAAGLDSEVSKNGDTFADCTNEATEIGSTGLYYLLLTAAELTADVVTVQVKTSTTGAKSTPLVFFPRKLVSLRSGTSQAGAAGTITLDSGASAVDDFYNGCLIVGTLDGTVEARIITDYAGSTKVASVTPNWNTTPDSDDTFIVYLPEGVQLPLLDASVSSRASQTSVDTVDDFLDTEVAAIKAKTDNLPSDPADASDIAASFSTLTGKVDVIDDFLDTEIAAIKAKTDGLPSDPADASDVAAAFSTVNSTLSTIAGYVDTEVAAIKAITDALITRTNTAQAGAAGTITLDAGASAVDDFYNYQVIQIVSGTGAGQARIVSDYVGATKVATVNGNWATNPDNTSVFALRAFGAIPGATAPTAADIRAEIDANSTKLDVAVSTRASQTSVDTVDDFLDTEVAAIKAKTDNLPASPAAVGSAMTLTAAYDAAKTAATQASVDDIPTNAELATALAAADDAVLAAVAALNNISAAGVRTAVGLASANLDTQLAALAAYIDTEVAAIKAKTDALPSDPADASDIAASFSSLASTLTTIAGYVDTEVAAIKAKTDLIPAAPAAVGDIPTAIQNADALLKRDFSAVTGEASRSLLNAARFLRNKWAISGATLSVKKEDDSTEAWAGAVTQTAGDPVSAIDPA